MVKGINFPKRADAQRELQTHVQLFVHKQVLTS